MTLELVDASLPVLAKFPLRARGIHRLFLLEMSHFHFSFLPFLPKTNTTIWKVQYSFILLYSFIFVFLKAEWIINIYSIEYSTHKILWQFKSELKLDVVWEARMTCAAFTLTAFHWRWHSRRSWHILTPMWMASSGRQVIFFTCSKNLNLSVVMRQKKKQQKTRRTSAFPRWVLILCVFLGAKVSN